MTLPLLLTLRLLLAATPQLPEAAPLTVTLAGTGDRPRHPADGVALTLSRALTPADGQLAVMIAGVDWTGLLRVTGTSVEYRDGAARVPEGDSPVVVYLVTSSNAWREIATLTLHVTKAARFDTSKVGPAIDLEEAGQAAEAHVPDTNAPDRSTFADFTSHFGAVTEHARGGVRVRTQTNLLAVSNETQALRFAQAGAAAYSTDLSDYVWTIDAHHTTLAFGDMTLAFERHLAPKFPTRGLSVTSRVARADFRLAFVNGQRIVGFPNFFGVSTAQNRIALATVGLDLVAARPKGPRVEASVLDGERLARPGFTQGQINDVISSRGGSLRFLSNDGSRRLRLDSGVARSWSTNPDDPQLSQGLTLVPVRPKTGDAEYVDAAYDLIRRPSSGTTMTGSYRFERVDPLFLSVMAPQGVHSDLLQHVASLETDFGAITTQVSEAWSHDNLTHVASILRTNSELLTVNAAVPTASFSRSKTPSAWLPVVSYGLTRSSQIGEDTPANGGFISASQIPDQVSSLNSFNADWKLRRFKFGYALTHSDEDNRQPGREQSDFLTTTHQVSFGVTPRPAFTATCSLNHDEATNVELDQITRTLRGAVTLAWTIARRNVVNANVNRTTVDNPSGGPSRVANVNLQYAYVFSTRARGQFSPNGRAFARWTWQSSDAFDLIAGLANVRRNWSLNAGVTFALFQ